MSKLMKRLLADTTIQVASRMTLECEVRADKFNKDERTVDIVWAAGAAVKRYSWDEGYYMEELSMDPKHIRMDRFAGGMSFLDGHDAQSGMDARLGTVVPSSVRIENGKGYATVKLSRNARGEALYQDLLDGHPFPVSVGYKTHGYEKREGSEASLPTLRAIDWEPMELSSVPIPADAGAHSRGESPPGDNVSVVTVRRDETRNDASRASIEELKSMKKRDAAKKFTGETLDAFAVGFGYTRNEGENDEALRVRLLAHFDTLDATETKRAEDDRVRREQEETATRAAEAARIAAQGNGQALTQAQLDDMTRAAVATERKRCDDIRSYGTRLKASAEIVNKAISDGLNLEQFRMLAIEEAAVRHENNPTRSGGHADFRGGQDERKMFREAAINAISYRLGLIEAKDLTEQGRELRGMVLLDVAKEEMRLRNESTRGSVNEIAGRAFHTTSDFPLIMGEITKRTVLAGYQGYPNTYQLISNRNVVPDFREVKTLELGAAPDLEKVNEHGEYKSGTITMSEEGYKIETYGKMIGFTRQLLINDQVNAFANVVRQWGAKAAKLEGDVVWGTIIANDKLKDGLGVFHANHLNLAATGTALSAATLGAARTAMRKYKDLDGTLMPVVPRYLFVGSALEPIASQIVAALYQPTTAANVTPEWIKALTVVYEPRLDALGDTMWHLFADPSTVNGRGLQHAFLQGQEEPFTDEEIGFNIDGTKYKIRHDFGAGVTDYRFGYRNAGAAQP